MSYAAERWARAQCVGNARAKQVLIELANCLNDETGLCCPGLEYLHRVTELKKDTISTATNYLERQGFLKKLPLPNPKGRGIQYALAYKSGQQDHPENGVKGNPENGVLTDKGNREKEPTPAPVREGESCIPSIPIRPKFKAWPLADRLVRTGDPEVLALVNGNQGAAVNLIAKMLSENEEQFRRVRPLLVKHQIGV